MPAGAHGDEKGRAVRGLVFKQFFDEFKLVFQVGEVSVAQLFSLAVEFIAEALEEEHSEDEFLELRGIHLAPQDVGGLEEKRFELGEGDFFSGQERFLCVFCNL